VLLISGHSKFESGLLFIGAVRWLKNASGLVTQSPLGCAGHAIPTITLLFLTQLQLQLYFILHLIL